MISKMLVALLIGLFESSCSQQTPQNGLQNEKHPNHYFESNTGLLIDNGINRGTNYTDSLGTKFSLRYIPIHITNDSTIPIHLQLAFSEDYQYSIDERSEQFRIIPLPIEWALNGVEITDKMKDELKNYLAKPTMNKTIDPGENILIGIGTLYPRPSTISGILPNELFVHRDRGMYSECEWKMEEDPSNYPEMRLWLKLVFGGKCMVVGCRRVAYSRKIE